MDKIFRFIESHIEDDITVKMLADEAGYSEFYFIKKFKEKTNCTPMEYVWRRKLVRATDDIVAEKRIIDVAFRYGFHTQSAFDKAFRRAFGFSPSFFKSIQIGINEMKGKSIFYESTQTGTPKEALFAHLLEIMEKNAIAYDKEEMEKLYHLSCQGYEGKKRYSSEEYVIHPLNTACILAEMEADVNTISAAFFCDIDRKGSKNLEDFRSELPVDVFALASEVQDHEGPVAGRSEEAMTILLAERLHNMRTFEFIDPAKRADKIRGTIDVYLPIARRFENQKIIDELNDLAMKYA